MKPKPFHPLKTLFVASVLIGLTVWTYYFRDIPMPPHFHWQGRTMGTTWSIKGVNVDLERDEADELLGWIQLYLRELNKQVSTYDPESQISTFNQAPTGLAVAISCEFETAYKYATNLHHRSEGAFHPAIEPLVRLWGFGGGKRPRETPPEETIQSVLETMSLDGIRYAESSLTKTRNPAVQLDLNAVVKGLAVDACADKLLANGVTNCMVEIGGEVRAHGVNSDGTPWALGIQEPVRDASGSDRLFGIVGVSDAAMATSGDYRNYYRNADGIYATHILDPRTGRPSTHALASVTIIAPTCMQADGLATTVFIMGPREGLDFIESQPEIEALLILRQDGSPTAFAVQTSSGFEELVSYEPVL